jgi:transposase
MRSEPAYFYVTQNGYEKSGSGDKDVFIHHLVRIAEGEDPSDVFGITGTVTHHANGIPWDNRPENLEAMTNVEHAKHHWEEGVLDNLEKGRQYDHSDDPWWDEDRLREMYHGEGMTMEEVADEFGVSQSTIQDRFDDFGIETRSTGRSKPQPWRSRDRLREEYVEKDKTQEEVAEELGCSTFTVRKWLKKFDLRDGNRKGVGGHCSTNYRFD